MINDDAPIWDTDDQAAYDAAVAREHKPVIYCWYLRDSGYVYTGFDTLAEAIARAQRDSAAGPAAMNPWWVSDGTQHFLVEIDGSLIPMTAA